MQKLSKTDNKNKAALSCSSVIVAYKSKTGLFRGFAVPYDVTYESDDLKKVKSVMRDMVHSYVEALEEYGYPEHLKNVPISFEEDKEKFDKISQELFSRISEKKITTRDYYAEVQLPT